MYIYLYISYVFYMCIFREKDRGREGEIHMLVNLAYGYLAGRAVGNWRLVLSGWVGGIKRRSGANQKVRNEET